MHGGRATKSGKAALRRLTRGTHPGTHCPPSVGPRWALDGTRITPAMLGVVAGFRPSGAGVGPKPTPNGSEPSPRGGSVLLSCDGGGQTTPDSAQGSSGRGCGVSGDAGGHDGAYGEAP